MGSKRRENIRRTQNCFEGISPPIIAITADVTEEIEARCMDVGIDVFMKKPVGAKELTAVLLEYAKKKKRSYRSYRRNFCVVCNYLYTTLAYA